MMKHVKLNFKHELGPTLRRVVYPLSIFIICCVSVFNYNLNK